MRNKSLIPLGIIIMLFSIVVSCHSEYSNHPAYNDLTYKEKIKLKQYVVQGKDLYELHCQSCHQSDGSGLGRLIPPISQSTYLANAKKSASCIVKYGLKGPWEVDSIAYNGVMPSNNQLTNLEIAEIITFVGNTWENKIGLVSSGDVESALSKCQ